MDPKIPAELMLATCRSVKELRTTGALPTEQADGCHTRRPPVLLLDRQCAGRAGGEMG